MGVGLRKVWPLLLSLSLSCDDHLLGDAAPVGVSCLRDPPLTYENYGAPIIDRHCNSCHSVYSRVGQRGDAPEGVDFDTWEDVVFWADRIYERTSEAQDMPPAGGMVVDERALMAEWMRCEVFPSIGIFDDGNGDAEDGS